MQQEYALEKICALFADGDKGQCSAIRLYGISQQEIEVSAVLGSGDAVLEVLRGGLCPDVLVLDSMLRQPGIIELLRQISLIPMRRSPHILLTCFELPERETKKLLTLGVEHIILKPYSMQELFSTTFCWGSSEGNFMVYRVREQVYRLLTALQISRGTYAVNYLEKLLCYEVLQEKRHTAEEIYALVAQSETITPAGVAKAVRRLSIAMQQAGSETYRQMCIENGKPADAKLTNNELIRTLAEKIRRAMCR